MPPGQGYKDFREIDRAASRLPRYPERHATRDRELGRGRDARGSDPDSADQVAASQLVVEKRTYVPGDRQGGSGFLRPPHMPGIS